jgi:outer membrane protein OmpA-like peptidoglycan-associated protein
LYIGGGVGVHVPQNTAAGPDGFPIGGSHLRLEQQSAGFVALGSIGYALGNGARFEIEGNFNQNGMRALGRLPVTTSASGSIRHYGVMVNALFDMDVGSPWVYPYIGAGVGYQQTSAVNVAITQNGGPFAFRTNDSQGAFAMQAIVGLSFPIPNMPGLSITPEYRFMDILGGPRLKGTVNGTTPADIQLHNQFDHNFIVGVRYAFNVPPPPMPEPAPSAVPAAAAARSYLVFFDWDKATLTDRARGIVKDAAAGAAKVAHTRIDVNGYTDTSGTHAYNQGLSMRRAQTVAAELVRNGVAKTDIAITALGETHPLVPTGPNVREPQNRRVEIILH